MTDADIVARRRFMILNLVRLFALAIVMVGLANLAEKLWPELAPTLGAVLVIVGVGDFFFAPILLKRVWRRGGQ